MKSYEEIESEIAGDFKIKFTHVEDDESIIDKMNGDRDSFVDNCYILGSDEIIVGLYENKEHKLASIFHELGHVLAHRNSYNPSQCTMNWEILCWNSGIDYAWSKYNLLFSEDTIKWAYEKALSYYHYA